MATWNVQYKQNPPDDNNPGYGAAAIRDLKTNIEGVVGREHDFDLVTPANQGKHLAGSAILDLDADPNAVNNLQKGRLKATSSGTTATMQIKGASSDLNVKGYDQVSKADTETITGAKTFTTSPVVTATISDASPDTALANVGYVKTKTATGNIVPTINNVGTTVNKPITDIYASTITTINSVNDVSTLEALLGQVSTELEVIRNALNLVASHNSFGQNLRTSDTPTFAGITVNGVASFTDNITTTGDITGARVYGAVWG